MYLYKLTDDLFFPDLENTTEDGILAFGGDLSLERLLLAYNSGIFPWYSEGEPILWWSPLERMVVFPEEFSPSKSMKKIMKKGEFRITHNKAFLEVVLSCARIKRKDQQGTWLQSEMVEAYLNLHQQGFAKSIEVWKEDELVGGLYGVEVGQIFCGESMFSKVSNTSKLAFIELVQNGGYQLIDCQVYNDHLASLGAREIPRNEFIQLLDKYR